MRDLPMLTADDVANLVPMKDAVDALQREFSRGVNNVNRTHQQVPGAEFLVMPAATPEVFGAKLVTVVPGNAGSSLPIIAGLYVLLSATDGQPIALLDGAALTSLRTPAASAVATDALARRDVSSIGIIGTGPQAWTHPSAIRAVRPAVSSVVVAGRDRNRVAAVVERVRSEGFDAVEGSYAQAAACDVVCTCTRSDTPLFGAREVAPGTHLNLVGSYRLDLREVASDLIASSTVVVDDRAAARSEAGELAFAAQEGVWSWDRIAGDLSDAAARRVVRRSNAEITLFKSVGLAVQDLIVAQLAAERAGYTTRA